MYAKHNVSVVRYSRIRSPSLANKGGIQSKDRASTMQRKAHVGVWHFVSPKDTEPFLPHIHLPNITFSSVGRAIGWKPMCRGFESHNVSETNVFDFKAKVGRSQ